MPRRKFQAWELKIQRIPSPAIRGMQWEGELTYPDGSHGWSYGATEEKLIRNASEQKANWLAQRKAEREAKVVII